MATLKTRKSFFDSTEGIKIRLELQRLDASSLYNTTPSYSSNNVLYPDNRMPFVDKHMNYLINHPSLDANKYLANIKLMTRLR